MHRRRRRGHDRSVSPGVDANDGAREDKDKDDDEDNNEDGGGGGGGGYEDESDDGLFFPPSHHALASDAFPLRLQHPYPAFGKYNPRSCERRRRVPSRVPHRVYDAVGHGQDFVYVDDVDDEDNDDGGRGYPTNSMTRTTTSP